MHNLTELLTLEILTLFQAASRVSTFHAPEKEQESQENTQDYGQNKPESLARFDPVTHGLKTRQCLLFEDSTESFATLPR